MTRFSPRKVLEREGKINELQVRFKESHIDRMNRGVCALPSNYVFLDFIDNMEKIADHLTNIAQGVINKMQWTLVQQKKLTIKDA